MAIGRVDEFEMGERKQDEINREEEESSFDDNYNDIQRRLDNLRNLTMEGNGSETAKPVDISGYVPDPTSGSKEINLSITNERKKFLKDNLDLTINVKDGPASKELLREMVVTFNANGKANAIEYKGKRVIVSKNGGKTFQYSDNQRYRNKTNRFKILLNKAIDEHKNTPAGNVEQLLISEGVSPNDNLTNSIISNSKEKNESELDEFQTIITREAKNISIDKQDVRELGGSLNPIGTSDATIDSLETQANTA